MFVHINKFVRRQTLKSEFSHWTLPDEELLAEIERNFHKAKQSYREGVVLVPVNPEGFYSSTITLKPGDLLVGEFKSRTKGEAPRKSVYVTDGKKSPAKNVFIVLYRHDVLVENNEHETDAEWEVISVNAYLTDEEEPISVGALLANHFQLSGGTATNLSDSEFVALLRKSVVYWQDKCSTAPAGLSQLL